MTFNFLGPGLTVNVEAKVKEQIILDSSDVESKIVTLKALRFAIILPAAFTAVAFIEVPKMIWQDRASELVSSGLETFIVVAVINLILLALTYRYKVSNTPAQ